MGVKNLKKFIQINFPESIVTEYLIKLKGCSIAIDTPCFLYDFKRRGAAERIIKWWGKNRIGFLSKCTLDDQCKTAPKQADPPNLNSDDWLNLVSDFLLKMKTFEIKVLFIFEGKSPIQKSQKVKERKKNKKQTEKKNQELNNSIIDYYRYNKINKNLLKLWNKIKRQESFLINDETNFDINKIIEFVSKNSPLSITKDDYDNFLNILNKLNIIFIKQNFEAETWCCYLKYLGSVNEVYSKDTDVILYTGIDRCIIDISDNTFTFIDKLKLLKYLKMDNNTFLDFCILVGNDYSYEKTQMYIFKAFELFKKYKTLENIFLKGAGELIIKDKKKLNIYWQRKFFNYEFIY